jgi:hypothetical protein
MARRSAPGGRSVAKLVASRSSVTTRSDASPSPLVLANKRAIRPSISLRVIRRPSRVTSTATMSPVSMPKRLLARAASTTLYPATNPVVPTSGARNTGIDAALPAFSIEIAKPHDLACNSDRAPERRQLPLKRNSWRRQGSRKLSAGRARLSKRGGSKESGKASAGHRSFPQRCKLTTDESISSAAVMTLEFIS